MGQVDWELYFKLLKEGNEGSTERDVAIQEALDNFTESVVNNPAYQEGALVNGNFQPIVARRKNTSTCLINCLPGDRLYIGDMVECYDEDWIVTELYTDQLGITYGKMLLCNETITFQNFSPEIYSYKCVVDKGSYPKLDTTKDVQVMTNTYKIYITQDYVTNYLFVDKRLGLGLMASSDGSVIMQVCQIIGIDSKSGNVGNGSHILILTVQADVYNAERDNMCLNICDYIKNEKAEQSSTQSGSCLIGGKNAIRIGSQLKFSGVFFTNDRNINNNIVAVWTVTAPEGVTYTIDNESGLTCMVKVPMDDSLIGQTIKLKLTDENGTYGDYTKEVTVVTIG